MPQIAKAKIKLVGTFGYIVEECMKLKGQCYELDSVKQKRNWPMFWQKIYTVKLVKEVYVDMKILCDTSGFDKAMDDINNSLKK
jgi:hypothetical protein